MRDTVNEDRQCDCEPGKGARNSDVEERTTVRERRPDPDDSPESPEQRESCVRNDLLLRLRNVCKDLPEEEFQNLVSAMTREQLRSERLRNGRLD